MAPSAHIRVNIDLARIRQNVQAIASQTRVPIIAVVKADGYGLGAKRVVEAIGDLVSAFYFFDLSEAIKADVKSIAGKRSIVLTGEANDPDDYIRKNITPIVWSVDRATVLKRARPILSIDTGQGRFSAKPDALRMIIQAGQIDEVMTHATTVDQVSQLIANLQAATGDAGKYFKHAAGSALLNEPTAWLDAVRPGLATYQSAVTVSAPLQQATDSAGPVGYTRQIFPRYGVILAGYSNGIRTGPCIVNGTKRRIFEVGMQTSFVEIGPQDHDDDEVILLGEQIALVEIAKAWSTTAQEVLVRLAGSGLRDYSGR